MFPCSGGHTLIMQLDNYARGVTAGLRHVRPYKFKMTTYAKLRWIGRSVLDVVTDEFCVETVENYVS